MEMTSSASAEKPLVATAKMPKIKIPGKGLVKLNAFASSFAIFFGGLALFGAIASFTKKWDFSIPVLSGLFGSQILDMIFGSTVLGIGLEYVLGLLALCCGIIAFLTMYKITDIEVLKKTYHRVAIGSGIVASVAAFEMVAIIIFSLMAVGCKAYRQGDLWLNGFVTNLIVFVFAGAVSLIARQIAKGKTQMLRIMGIVALVAAILSFVLVFVAFMVGLYGEGASGLEPGGMGLDFDLNDMFKHLF